MTNDSPLPDLYSPEWVRLPEGYVSAVARALRECGLVVADLRTDPLDPRDAMITVQLAPDAPRAGSDPEPVTELRLVWDEESGWRSTITSTSPHHDSPARYLLTAELLPAPSHVAAAVRAVLAGESGGTTHRPHHRSFRDYQDGFDTRLAQYRQHAYASE